MNTQTHSLVYGPRPSREGFGVVSESGDFDEEDRSQLVSFCKSIRWSPDKGDAPDLKCVAVVPTPKIYWICRIDETTDDMKRPLAIRVTATGFERSDSEATQRIRAELIDEGVDQEHIPDFGRIDKPVILTHREMLRYGSDPQPFTHLMQPPPEPKAVGDPCTISAKQSSIPQNHRGQRMKSIAFLLLGAVVAASLVWSQIVKPAQEKIDKLTKDNSEIQAKLRIAEEGKIRLSEKIQTLERENQNYREKIELSQIKLTDEQSDHLRMMVESDKLAIALVDVSNSIQRLHQKLPTKNNISEAVEDSNVPK